MKQAHLKSKHTCIIYLIQARKHPLYYIASTPKKVRWIEPCRPPVNNSTHIIKTMLWVHVPPNLLRLVEILHRSPTPVEIPRLHPASLGSSSSLKQQESNNVLNEMWSMHIQTVTTNTFSQLQPSSSSPSPSSSPLHLLPLRLLPLRQKRRKEGNIKTMSSMHIQIATRLTVDTSTIAGT